MSNPNPLPLRNLSPSPYETPLVITRERSFVLCGRPVGNPSRFDSDPNPQYSYFWVWDKQHLADYEQWLRTSADGHRNYCLEYARDIIRTYWDMEDHEFPAILELTYNVKIYPRWRYTKEEYTTRRYKEAYLDLMIGMMQETNGN
jgi:hypothetical protein